MNRKQKLVRIKELEKILYQEDNQPVSKEELDQTLETYRAVKDGALANYKGANFIIKKIGKPVSNIPKKEIARRELGRMYDETKWHNPLDIPIRKAINHVLSSEAKPEIHPRSKYLNPS